MEKSTLRRMGWVGASLGLTAALVGCADVQSGSDSTTSASVEPASTGGYLEANNGLQAINGLMAANGLQALNGLQAVNGLMSANGLLSFNGMRSTNGLQSLNGLQGTNGLQAVNGLDAQNGLMSSNGLMSTNGLMTTDGGRQTVSYLVRCALAAGDTLVKADQNGNNFTFKGGLGLVPGYKTGMCDIDCQEALSSCMMAHINTSGVHIPLWMTSPMSAIGWGQSPSYPTQEGTFFGNIMMTNKNYNLDAYYCNGPDVANDTVPGRLGQSSGAPYNNAYPASGGQCNAAGHCTMESHGDGALSCVGNSLTWTRPVTVWRGKTFQAENATLTGGAGIVNDSHNSNGKRVGYLGSTSGVKFSNVPSATAGINNLVVYYANGDTNGLRYFNIKVNGGAPQQKGFKYIGDWGTVGQATVSLSGFNANTSNTVEFVGDGTNNVPDLDWIEVIGATTNYCDHSRWTVSASNAGTSDPVLNAIDGYDVSRWTSGRNQDGTDWYKVDFGGFVTMSNMTLTNGNYDQNDYPAKVEFYASNDGTTFDSTPFATKSGSSDQTVVTFAPKTMRAVKLKEVGSRSNYWSIHEFNTDCVVADSQTAPPPPAGTCDRTKWIESASDNTADMGKATDGDLNSRWTTGTAMASGDYFTINFTGAVKISQITLNNTQTSGGDYPGTVALYASTDGTTFDSTAFATANGAANSTVITFAQRSLKAVKVKVTGTRSNWWSIGEFQAACTL